MSQAEEGLPGPRLLAWLGAGVRGMKWEAYFADRPLPVRDLKDLKPAKWAGQPRGNGESSA